MKSAREYYFDVHKMICMNHSDYMRFAEAYAKYVKEFKEKPCQN